MELLRGDDPAGRLVGIVDAGGPVRDVVGRLRARGYQTLDLITPARQRRGRARSSTGGRAAPAARTRTSSPRRRASSEVAPIDDTDRIPLPVLETHAPFVVVVGARALNRFACYGSFLALRSRADPGRPFAMSLRPFLAHLERHPHADELSAPGARAFVSQSLRPYLIAALADRDARRPTVVVAGDDRAARDLAQDLRAWLRPRAVRFYPSRGVAYESHLTPPAHLVGLRVAALDAAASIAAPGDRGAGRRRLRGRAVRRRSPTPRCARTASRCASASLLDLDECANDLVAAGYERVDQVEDRGQFAVRGGLLDVYPATEERAIRVDLFDDEIESLRWFSTFTQRSLGDTEVVEIAPAAELAAEHRELAEIAALENRRASGPTSPSCCRSATSATCST